MENRDFNCERCGKEWETCERDIIGIRNARLCMGCFNVLRRRLLGHTDYIGLVALRSYRDYLVGFMAYSPEAVKGDAAVFGVIEESEIDIADSRIELFDFIGDWINRKEE